MDVSVEARTVLGCVSNPRPLGYGARPLPTELSRPPVVVVAVVVVVIVEVVAVVIVGLVEMVVAVVVAVPVAVPLALFVLVVAVENDPYARKGVL
ncbi:hypothetical protein ElyMa_001130000 [Elysia marginata]|uniref:Uncharacterized protein n=1 Tax=Elysia marginata TaxID=1093978 RepID=A0AAV4HWV9_9GAST|nr:hypothetical protein ElyMa_001130000 [Elysia marginata]